jgi:5-formyltetrahydrofolate cyclo-ligase
MKKKLRQYFLQKRDSIPPEIKRVKEAAIEKRLFNLREFKEAKSILFYVSFGSEVNTRNCLEDVIAMKKRLILPRVDTRHRILRLFEIEDLSELSPGYMGILEPPARPDREVDLKDIDLIIIPGTGFDLKGHRLGYGGGYYDRLLSYESRQLSRLNKHIITIALAFEEQISEKIPAESHDIKVDKIITDRRIIRCT